MKLCQERESEMADFDHHSRVTSKQDDTEHLGRLSNISEQNKI
jgi:hypothetical protein